MLVQLGNSFPQTASLEAVVDLIVAARATLARVRKGREKALNIILNSCRSLRVGLLVQG
jgi:hypothetical protein